MLLIVDLSKMCYLNNPFEEERVMKLTRIHSYGRYTNPETGSDVNVKKGRLADSGADVLFYYRNRRRVFISCSDFHKNWVRREL